MRLLLILAAFAVRGGTEKVPRPRDDKMMANLLYQGEEEFSINLFRKVVTRKGRTENVFFSPLSLYNALLLAYFAADGQTEASLKKVLCIPDSVSKRSAEAHWVQRKQQLGEPRKYELSTPSKLFVANQLKIKSSMKSLFNDELTPLNFRSDIRGAVKHINSWVANETRNQIKEFIHPANSLHPRMNICMVSVAYFKGSWKEKFSNSKTSNRPFHISGSESVLVPMMTKKGYFKNSYSYALGARILEMPYEGNEVSMYVVLPSKGPDGLSEVLKRFDLRAFGRSVAEIDYQGSTWLEVSFPKFEIEESLNDLVQILESIGVGDLFQPTANLTQLTGEPNIQLNSVIHKAKVRVDEEGTEASATTGLMIEMSGFIEWKFNCNHPFIYLIYHKGFKSILFMGVFNKPPT